MQHQDASATQRNERLNIRASRYQKELIARAAKLKNTTLSDFVLEHAVEAAQNLLSDEPHIVLSGAQWEAFCRALDAPPKSIQALKKLLKSPGHFDAP